MISNNRVLVIIVTYNGLNWLNKCLSSVINSSINADLFIVDNGSVDGTIDFIKNNFRQAVLIESKENMHLTIILITYIFLIKMLGLNITRSRN